MLSWDIIQRFFTVRRLLIRIVWIHTRHRIFFSTLFHRLTLNEASASSLFFVCLLTFFVVFCLLACLLLAIHILFACVLQSEYRSVTSVWVEITFKSRRVCSHNTFKCDEIIICQCKLLLVLTILFFWVTTKTKIIFFFLCKFLEGNEN